MFSPSLQILLSRTYIDDLRREADAARPRSDKPARVAADPHRPRRTQRRSNEPAYHSLT